MKSSLPHSADLRKHRYDASEHVYFVTQRVAQKRLIDLTDRAVAAVIVQALNWLRNESRIWLLAFVVMPDHIHVIVAPRQPFTLAQTMKSLFGFSAKEINTAMKRKGSLWATEFYETHLTGRKTIEGAVEYIHQNPVRKNLCGSAADWPWSTAHPEHQSVDWDWYGRMG